MRKFILSAVILMAFSLNGFASTKQVAQLESKELELVQTCYDVAEEAENAYKLAMGANYTPEGGYLVFAAAYDACEKNGGPKKTISLN